MIVLGIETSCDETAASVVAWQQEAPKVLAERVASQVEKHARFGGIVPEIASRAHMEALPEMVRAVMQQAGLNWQDIDEIAVTQGPGLIGALLVGTGFARALGFAIGRQVRPVHHLEAHLFAPLLADASLAPPFLTLLVSGGHTMLLRTDAIGRHRLLGQTRDDAAGECFDKAARIMGLGYPGGPAIERAAQAGDATRFALPRPMRTEGLDFSFSGLKTAVMLAWQASGQDAQARADLAASLQAAVADVLATKLVRAAQKEGIDTVVVAGGVAANRHLRHVLEQAADAHGLHLVLPPLRYCTDNASMVALAGLLRARAGFPVPKRWDASARLALAQA